MHLHLRTHFDIRCLNMRPNMFTYSRLYISWCYECMMKSTLNPHMQSYTCEDSKQRVLIATKEFEKCRMQQLLAANNFCNNGTIGGIIPWTTLRIRLVHLVQLLPSQFSILNLCSFDRISPQSKI